MGPLQDLSIFYSMIMAVFILGEKLTMVKIAGFALVMLGPTVALRSGKTSPQRPASSTFTPVYAEGYLFAFLSGLCYGASPILVRMGLVDRDLSHSIAASCISYTGASLVIGAFLLLPGSMREVRRLDRRNAAWFVGAGFLVAFSQMTRYMALALAPVTVVAPIGRLSSVFRIYFSWLLNRQHEIFSSRIVAGTFVSLLGALLLSLDPELLATLWDWPESLRPALAWRWP